MRKRVCTLALVAAALLSPLVASAGQEVIPNGVQRIGAVGEGRDYSAINVAVIDTGIELENADLNVVGGVDCAAPRPMGMYPGDLEFTLPALADNWDRLGNPDATGYDDGVGHGTHVSGIIGARDNDNGVVGVAPGVSLWSVRVLGGMGGTITDIVCGLNWVHENRDLIDVVNMSLGAELKQPAGELLQGCKALYENGPLSAEEIASFGEVMPKEGERLRDPMHEAICQVVNDGIPVVVAAGNGHGEVSYVLPASYPEVFTVSNMVDNDGAPGGLGGRNELDACKFGGMDDTLLAAKNHTIDYQAESFSGMGVDFAAPGTCVLSTVPGGWASLTGTSMASPHVAGVVARYLGDHYDTPGAIAAYRATRDRKSVGELYATLRAAAEPQTADFRDVDLYPEPIIRVITEN